MFSDSHPNPTGMSSTSFGAVGVRGLREISGDDHAWLTSMSRPAATERRALRVVDLFCGAGGLSLGLREACSALGYGFEVALAADLDRQALAVFQRNFGPAEVLAEPVETLLSGPVGSPPTAEELAWARRLGAIDFVVGGPPCQGHSDLNNRTRRVDGRNELYLRMARAAEVLRPRFVLIENVVAARRDRRAVVDRTAAALTQQGYSVATVVLDASRFGVAQKRRRLILVAVRGENPWLELLEQLEVEPRDLEFAIGDLVGKTSPTGFDGECRSSPATRERIEYLFENNVYDLPNAQRPPCHRHGNHSYKSIYGRLRWNAPSQTITRGFYSMCMGRYVHPSERRTLTAHEAARLQFFPDSFDFSDVQGRSALAQIIGNAVPPKVAYALGVAMLATEALL